MKFLVILFLCRIVLFSCSIILATDEKKDTSPSSTVVDATSVQHIITTFAGTGIHGDSGDGGKATTALLSGPQGVSEDMHENGYVADAYNIKNRLVSQPQLLASTQFTFTGSNSGFYSIGGDGYYGIMSGTGQYLIGRRNAGQSNGQIAVSSNYGASATVSSTTFLYSSAVQVSVSGQYILTSTNGNGNVYTSSDYGSTWTTHSLACYWTPSAILAISSTGQYMAAGSNNYAGSTCGASGFFSASSDYGVTWSRRTATLCWHQLAFVSVSTSAATSGVMIVAIGSVFTSGTTSCSSTENVMTSLDLGVTWTVLSSTTLSPTLPAVPGGAVGSITVFYKVATSDVSYTYATITASTTSLQGTYGCPYIPSSASSNGQGYVAVDSTGGIRFGSSLTTWTSAVSPVAGTSCSTALLSGDGLSVTALCDTNVYRSTTLVFAPTQQPSSQPSKHPSRQPTAQPSRQPSRQPNSHPSAQPSRQPSARPSQPSQQPTRQPTSRPSNQPTRQPTSRPSRQPSSQPSAQPSMRPSNQPTSRPSRQPTAQPSRQPNSCPSAQPSAQPLMQPSQQPSQQPTSQPSRQPSSQPSRAPSMQPSSVPSRQPSGQPSRQPSSQPSRQPSAQPSFQPSCQPSARPSQQPSQQPTRQPTKQPVMRPSSQPSTQPIRRPTQQPSQQPTNHPTTQPTSKPSLPRVGCPAGMYSGRMDMTDVTLATLTCSQCSAGSYSKFDSAGCTGCPAGTISGPGATACSKCPAGYYSVNPSSDCWQCAAGSYAATAGSSFCTPCLSGQFSGSGATACSNCPAGYFTSSPSECAQCAAGSYTATAGSSVCTPCPSGQFSTPGASACTSCSA